jgi:hypothetical protein
MTDDMKLLVLRDVAQLAARAERLLHSAASGSMYDSIDVLEGAARTLRRDLGLEIEVLERSL